MWKHFFFSLSECLCKTAIWWAKKHEEEIRKKNIHKRGKNSKQTHLCSADGEAWFYRINTKRISSHTTFTYISAYICTFALNSNVLCFTFVAIPNFKRFHIATLQHNPIVFRITNFVCMIFWFAAVRWNERSFLFLWFHYVKTILFFSSSLHSK